MNAKTSDHNLGAPPWQFLVTQKLTCDEELTMAEKYAENAHTELHPAKPGHVPRYRATFRTCFKVPVFVSLASQAGLHWTIVSE